MITVADRGPGVPPEKRSRIFDMFFRSETGDRQGAGTGLGLAIVSGFVEAMGGRVSVAAREGGGAAFRLVLPQPAMPAMETDNE